MTGQKAYKLYNLESQKIIILRDVIFYENNQAKKKIFYENKFPSSGHQEVNHALSQLPLMKVKHLFL